MLRSPAISPPQIGFLSVIIDERRVEKGIVNNMSAPQQPKEMLIKVVDGHE